MDGVKDLLLEILFIILPIFIYQIFGVDKPYKIRRGRVQRTKLLVTTLLAGSSILMCMTFPIHILPGYVLDLRMIPFIIGIFYGGQKAGIALTCILLLYRFYLGGSGFYATFFVVIGILVAVPVLISNFNRLSKQQRILFAGVVSTVTAVLITIGCFYISTKNGYPLHLGKEPVSKFILYILLHPIAGTLAVFLIESLREKRFLQLEMQRLEKMRVLGDLATSVAHEIRNPMTVTRGFLQILKVPEDQQQYVDLAIKEVDRVEAIINDYLQVTRPELEALETIEVEESIRYTMKIMQPYASLHNVQLTVSHVESGTLIEAPRDKFIQLLVNFVKNGIESMPNGGCISFRVSRKRKHAVIGIRDNGGGMTREELMNLGLPYYSISEEGTDLGLMFCYRFVQVLNGTIEVKSEKGKGTEFFVELPISIQT